MNNRGFLNKDNVRTTATTCPIVGVNWKQGNVSPGTVVTEHLFQSRYWIITVQLFSRAANCIIYASLKLRLIICETGPQYCMFVIVVCCCCCCCMLFSGEHMGTCRRDSHMAIPTHESPHTNPLQESPHRTLHTGIYTQESPHRKP